jgi:hypothetical protein
LEYDDGKQEQKRNVNRLLVSNRNIDCETSVPANKSPSQGA